jgi:hypothetical protein
MGGIRMAEHGGRMAGAGADVIVTHMCEKFCMAPALSSPFNHKVHACVLLSHPIDRHAWSLIIVSEEAKRAQRTIIQFLYRRKE